MAKIKVLAWNSQMNTNSPLVSSRKKTELGSISPQISLLSSIVSRMVGIQVKSSTQ